METVNEILNKIVKEIKAKNWNGTDENAIDILKECPKGESLIKYFKDWQEVINRKWS